MKRGPTLQCGPTLHYSIDLRIRTYTELVLLKYGKLATKYPWTYVYFYSVLDRILCSSSLVDTDNNGRTVASNKSTQYRLFSLAMAGLC